MLGLLTKLSANYVRDSPSLNNDSEILRSYLMYGVYRNTDSGSACHASGAYREELDLPSTIPYYGHGCGWLFSGELVHGYAEIWLIRKLR